MTQVHPEQCTDDSVQGSDNAHININRFTVPGAGKERTVAIVLFALLLMSMTINAMNYARNGRNDEITRQTIKSATDKVAAADEELRQAKVDLKTQTWLASDSLTKENAAILAHTESLQDLVQAYGIGKKIPKPSDVKRKHQ